LGTPATAEPAYNWTGAYIGAQGGYAFGHASTKDTLSDWCTAGDTACIAKYVGPFNYSPSGAFGGVAVGFDVQLGSVVVGAESSLAWLAPSGQGRAESSDPTKHQDITLGSGLLGDATLRAGYLLLPAFLVYGKGGIAFYDGRAAQTTTKPGYITTPTDAFTGWVAGVGAEWQMTHKLSVRLEYDHYSFGSQGGMQSGDGGASDPLYHFRNVTSLSLDAVKAELAYKF
jgi:outer membrane immunogenic protein